MTTLETKRGRTAAGIGPLVDEVGGGLHGLSQLRARMASGRKPGILIALDFEIVEGEAGRSVFAGTPGKHADGSV